MAYVSDESGQQEVYVRPYPGSDRGTLVSRGGGIEQVWSLDGRELYYRNGDRMMAVEITTEPNLEIGEIANSGKRHIFLNTCSGSQNMTWLPMDGS